MKFAPDSLFSKNEQSYNCSDVITTEELNQVISPYAEVTIDAEEILQIWRAPIASKYSTLPGIRALHDFVYVDGNVKGCRQGSQFHVDYILQLPSGQSVHLGGLHDIFLLERMTSRNQIRRANRLRAVGETQSKPFDRKDSNKTATLAQAGIYGVGELTKTDTDNVAVLVLFKAKSAQVAVASRGTPAYPLPGSVGDASYKFIERVDPMSLKDKHHFQHFSRILVSTFRWIYEQSSPELSN